MLKKIWLTVLLGLALTLSACSGGIIQEETTKPVSTEYGTVSFTWGDDDFETGIPSSGVTRLSLQGDSISVTGKGVLLDGAVATIIQGGTYVLSGTLNEGQIIVNARQTGTVRLVLDGVDITCPTGAPIYIDKADKAVITLAEGSENYLTDGESYIFETEDEDEPNAAVFSRSDLTINGEGSLTVTARYNNGIQSKDTFKITGGTIQVTAVNDCLKGRDAIIIRDAGITLDAGGDGMQSTNNETREKGFIAIESGTLDISAANDGLQAETNLYIAGGTITILSGGGSKNSSTGTAWGFWGTRKSSSSTASGDTNGSAKGIKAGNDITIDGGTFVIDSSDDSLHSNGSLTVKSGTFELVSGDDGIHADDSLVINGGNIEISKSYEGVESNTITVNAGTIRVVSSDDGINAAGGADGSSIDGRPGQNMFGESSDSYLYVHGGDIYVNAKGDGIDINGSILMTGGTVIVDGPTENFNGALDYLGELKVTGGFLLAAGSVGMAQSPSTSSSQYSMIVNFTARMQAGAILRLETADGTEVLTCSPAKYYQSVVFSSPELKKGTSYVLLSEEGTEEKTLFEFTVSSIVTRLGSSSGIMPGGIRLFR